MGDCSHIIGTDGPGKDDSRVALAFRSGMGGMGWEPEGGTVWWEGRQRVISYICRTLYALRIPSPRLKMLSVSAMVLWFLKGHKRAHIPFLSGGPTLLPTHAAGSQAETFQKPLKTLSSGEEVAGTALLPSLPLKSSSRWKSPAL